MNPRLILAAFWAVAIAVAIVTAYQMGKKTERAAWVERDNKATIEASEKLRAANERTIEAERKSARDMASISENYQKDLENAKRATAAAIAAHRDRLRQPRQSADGGDTVPEACTTACGCDAAERCGFSESDAEFLISFAGEADEIVHQLMACQSVVRKDRE